MNINIITILGYLFTLFIAFFFNLLKYYEIKNNKEENSPSSYFLPSTEKRKQK